ncbi:MAG: hypothetical protein ACTSW1_12565 [Candidatus Hodarchaeales archaeon]
MNTKKEMTGDIECLNCQTILTPTSDTVQCPACGMYNHRSKFVSYAYKTLHCIGIRNDRGLNTIELTKTVKQNKTVFYSIYTSLDDSCDEFEVAGEKLKSILREFLDILEQELGQ